MSKTDPFKRLVSPVTGDELFAENDSLTASDGAKYPIYDGIADLIDARLQDDESRNESELFDTIPLQNVCYFRQSLFSEVIELLRSAIKQPPDRPMVAVEIGGGEGYFASTFLNSFAGAQAYVGDISRRALSNADPALCKIRCDARHPYLTDGSVDVAAFWVSLHHFHGEDLRAALKEATRILAPGGVLLVFEPNGNFLPRRLFLKMALSKLVYYDKEEAINLSVIEEQLAKFGFLTKCGFSHSPPYSTAFLRHFKLWPLFFCATEFFYRLGRIFEPANPWVMPTDKSRTIGRLWNGSYVLAIFQRQDVLLK